MINRYEREPKLIKAARIIGAGLQALPYLLGTASVAHADHDGVTRNQDISDVKAFEYFHPMSGDQVWSYGVQLRNPLLGGAGMEDTAQVGEVRLTGAVDVGLDLRTDPSYIRDYVGDGANPAIWFRGRANQQLLVLDQSNSRNDVVGEVVTDDTGFGGAALSNEAQQLGFRQVNSTANAEPVIVTIGNISFPDLTKIPNSNVYDARNIRGQVVSAPAAVVESAEAFGFLPEEQVLNWADGEGKGFFRPLSLNGEGYSKFIEVQTNSTSLYAFRDKGNVGEVFAQVRGAGQVRLDFKTHEPYVEDIRQSDQGGLEPAIWVSKAQPNTLIQVHGVGGEVLYQSRTDGAGEGGARLPRDGQYVLTLDIPFPNNHGDIQLRLGKADQAALNKPSTAK